MITSDSTDKVYPALLTARGSFPELRKDTEAHYGKFVSFNTIRDQIDPILAENKLAIFQIPDTTADGKPALTTTLRHESGQFIQATTPLALSKQDPQAQGSAITYMKRYSYNTLLSLKNLDEDDDGDVASLPDKQVQTKSGGNRETQRLVTELEAAAKAAGLTKAQLAKKYHDEYGKDYKHDTDEGNLAAALVKVGMKGSD